MNKNTLIGIFLVLIIGGIFYWFQWRPSQIRKECSRPDSLSAILGIDRYETCLRQHGLEDN